MNSLGFPKYHDYKSLTPCKRLSLHDQANLSASPFNMYESESSMNTVRAKEVKSNKIHLPILVPFLHFSFILICSVIPSLYVFGYLTQFINFLMYIYPVVVTIISYPLVRFILDSIAQGVTGNAAHDLIKIIYRKAIAYLIPNQYSMPASSRANPASSF